MRLRVVLAVVAAAVVGAFGVTMSEASSAPTARTQHITGFTDNPNEQGIGAIWAFGPVSGRGHDVVINEHKDQFVFAHGSLTITHHITHQHDNFDPTTCVFQHEEQGTYTVTGGSGTYAGAHGSGTYKLNVLGQGCDEHAPPTTFALTLDAIGPLTV